MAFNFCHTTELSGKMVFVLCPLLPSAAATQLCSTMAKLDLAYSLVSLASLNHYLQILGSVRMEQEQPKQKMAGKVARLTYLFTGIYMYGGKWVLRSEE